MFCVRDLIVIYVPWLGNQLIGDLLSFESRLRVRATGVYTLDDFQATFNQCDAVAVLDLLEAMDVCVRVWYLNGFSFDSINVFFIVCD